jgi:hypothetical protein
MNATRVMSSRKSTEKSLKLHAKSQRRKGFAPDLLFFALLAALRETFLQGSHLFV